MRRSLLIIPGALIALFLLSPASTLAQGEPTEAELRENIKNLEELDPDVAVYLPRWRILEADLKTKLMLYFRSQGFDMKTSDTVVVTAGFDRDNGQEDILKIEVPSLPGASLNGRAKIESELGEGLYQELLQRSTYAHANIERESPLTEGGAERVPNVLYPTNARQFAAVSAFRQAIQLGTTGARLEHLIGTDQVGYPFWSGGQAKALVEYPIIRQDDVNLRAAGVPDILKFSLGIGYRLKFGQAGESGVADIFSPRLLNGAIGAKAIVATEYRLPQVNDLGVSIYAELPLNKRTGTESVEGDDAVVWVPGEIRRRSTIPVRKAYFLRTIAQGNFFWETWLNNYEHYFRFSLGASYQEVAEASLRVGTLYLDPDGETLRNKQGVVQSFPARPAGLANNVEYSALDHPDEVGDWIFAKIEYLNQSDFPFGFSAQLANRNLLLNGFVPIIPNWLFLQAKYSTPLLSDPQPWEQQPVIIVSPILRFMLD